MITRIQTVMLVVSLILLLAAFMVTKQDHKPKMTILFIALLNIASILLYRFLGLQMLVVLLGIFGTAILFLKITQLSGRSTLVFYIVTFVFIAIIMLGSFTGWNIFDASASAYILLLGLIAILFLVIRQKTFSMKRSFYLSFFLLFALIFQVLALEAIDHDRELIILINKLR